MTIESRAVDGWCDVRRCEMAWAEVMCDKCQVEVATMRASVDRRRSACYSSCAWNSTKYLVDTGMHRRYWRPPPPSSIHSILRNVKALIDFRAAGIFRETHSFCFHSCCLHGTPYKRFETLKLLRWMILNSMLSCINYRSHIFTWH
jgi:hypothetical protein